MHSSYNKVVILEGPDGSGKTPLAHQLQTEDLWGGKVPGITHEGPPMVTDMLDYYGNLLQLYLKHDAPVICDRFHVGETVYGPTCRGTSLLGERGRALLDRLCAANGVHVVLVLPDFERCRANWREKNIDYVKDETVFWQVYWRYKALEPCYHVYDYVVENAYQVLCEKLATPMSTLPVGCVGSPHARCLVVGEQTNGYFDLPFFTLNNSSEYLNSALQEAGFCEADLALVNALNISGKPNQLAEVVASLPNLQSVVTLGRQASLAVNRVALPPGCRSKLLPHPAHWKRFHAHDRTTYVAQLQEVRNGLL